MAKLRYSWSKVSPGDIISFVYENKKGRRLRRTILVLDPKHKNLMHGIQLEVSNIPTNPEIKKILESAGTTQIVDGDKKIYRVRIYSNNLSDTIESSVDKLQKSGYSISIIKK